MSRTLPEPLERLLEHVEAKRPLGASSPPDALRVDALAAGADLYTNRNERLGIDFNVKRLQFPDIQTMDPRVLRIAPGRCNELHKHAHETIFVVLRGEGEVRLGEAWSRVTVGAVAFVPRWILHQTRNTSDAEELVILAITDFGFTSAVLGDYDRRTRLATGTTGDPSP